MLKLVIYAAMGLWAGFAGAQRLDIPLLSLDMLAVRPGANPDVQLRDNHNQQAVEARYGPQLALADGVISFDLADFFPNGISLGAIARGDLTDIKLSVYSSGLVTIDAWHHGSLRPSSSEAAASGAVGLRGNPDNLAGVGLFKVNGRLGQIVDDERDFFFPLWCEPASSASCSPENGANRVYMWASVNEAGWQGVPTVVITWFKLNPRGGCRSGAEVSFQLIIAADTDADSAIIQFRYDPMGLSWASAVPECAPRCQRCRWSCSDCQACADLPAQCVDCGEACPEDCPDCSAPCPEGCAEDCLHCELCPEREDWAYSRAGWVLGNAQSFELLGPLSGSEGIEQVGYLSNMPATAVLDEGNPQRYQGECWRRMIPVRRPRSTTAV